MMLLIVMMVIIMMMIIKEDKHEDEYHDSDGETLMTVCVCAGVLCIAYNMI